MLDGIFSVDFYNAILRSTTPILFATMASAIASKVGITNMALEGIMLFSALFGVIFTSFTNNFLLGLILTMIMGSFIALILAFAVLKLKADEILSAVAINLMATGGTVLIMLAYSGDRGVSSSIQSIQAPVINIPYIENIPFLGDFISGKNLMTYLAVLSVVFVHILLYKTPLGLKIRAVGESQNSAKSVGISVTKIQCIALGLSGALASMGGFFLSGGYMSMFTKDMSAGKGFIALAASSMGGDTPIGGFIVAVLFGTAQAVANMMQLTSIPQEFIQMIPYLTTLIGLGIYSYSMMKKSQQKGKL